MITLTDIGYAYPDAEHFALEKVSLRVERGRSSG